MESLGVFSRSRNDLCLKSRFLTSLALATYLQHITFNENNTSHQFFKYEQKLDIVWKKFRRSLLVIETHFGDIRFLTSPKGYGPYLISDRSWYHSKCLDELIRMYSSDCPIMDFQLDKSSTEVGNSEKTLLTEFKPETVPSRGGQHQNLKFFSMILGEDLVLGKLTTMLRGGP